MPRSRRAAGPSAPADLRSVFERHLRTNRWELRVSSLRDFVDFAGRDLTVALCRCYVQADRINSLAIMLYFTRPSHTPQSVAEIRDSLTFDFFMMGTLWEYSDALSQLREAEKRRRIFDRSAWKKLDRCKRVGESTVHRVIRNEAAFHVDRNLVSKGVSKVLKATKGPFAILAGDDDKQRNSFGRLAHEALVSGLAARTRGRLLVVTRDLAKFLAVHDDLDPELHRILKELDLKPIHVKLAGS
jgi:hypothetical protein